MQRYAAPPVITPQGAGAGPTRRRRAPASTYDKVLALEAWLGANTRYTLDIPPLPADADAVDQFLFVDRRGFCEQIATSLVVMLRSLGDPGAGGGRLRAGSAQPVHRAVRSAGLRTPICGRRCGSPASAGNPSIRPPSSLWPAITPALGPARGWPPTSPVTFLTRPAGCRSQAVVLTAWCCSVPIGVHLLARVDQAEAASGPAELGRALSGPPRTGGCRRRAGPGGRKRDGLRVRRPPCDQVSPSGEQLKRVAALVSRTRFRVGRCPMTTASGWNASSRTCPVRPRHDHRDSRHT